jgi:uncharacterized membrane protein HdeD (DUF308 family)
MSTIPAVGRHGSTLSIVWGILLVIFGLIAVAIPFLASVAVTLVVAWLIIFGGIVHIVLGFHSHGAGSVIWKLLVGIAYLVVGGYMLLHPVLGAASLTLVLAALFLIEGILNIVLYFKMRPMHGAGWVLFDGIVTLLLGALIYLQWPLSSVWAIGILVGISMVISGFARIGLSVAVRRAVPPAAAPAAGSIAA